jgi:hypothetical protein
MARTASFKILLAFLGVLGLFWALSGSWYSRGSKKRGIPDKISYNWHVRPILSDRCFACHGPDEKKREGGLRLDTRDGALAALGEQRDHHAIVPGQPGQSTLVSRIFSGNADSLMPPPASHLSLNDTEKAILRRWIEQGAPYETHWAFIAPQRPALPRPENADWARNPIDLFILDKQQENGLAPSAEAPKERLLRRLFFDITGLPPSPEQTARFLADNSADAYEKMVDSLLASPAYGERMAMNWLDLARYSDTHGYQDDLPRTMWPWRDWVIKAFNENMPYDRFVTWQLAGDLLPDANKETLLASAFNRNHKINQEGGIIDEEYRVEYVVDRTNTFSKAFLGLTMECARCHDHKYDPVSTRDFYALSAYFNKVPERGFVTNLAVPKPYMPITQSDLQGVLRFLNAKGEIKTEKDTLLQMVMQDSTEKGGRQTFILKRGQYDQHGDTVQCNVPASVLPLQPALLPNRLGLSQWLFDARHPLTARVMVNRMWQELFGRGIVFTTENFGVQGALPSHPELLDWLAVEFRESGWDVKKLIRLMVTSATYRQSSETTAELLEKDPENVWLAHGPRYRYPYEFIRDQALAAAGLLENVLGGPSVKPWQPPGLWEEISTEESANNFRGEFAYMPDTAVGKRYRRSIYTHNRRTVPPPTHLIFDAPMRDNCEVRRTRTSTPLQALALLNDRQILEASRVLAARLMQQYPAESPEMRIRQAFQRILCRKAGAREIQVLQDLYTEELARYQKAPEKAARILQNGLFPPTTGLDTAEQTALALVISALFNLDETINKT